MTQKGIIEMEEIASPPAQSEDLSPHAKPSRSRRRAIVWIVMLVVFAALFALVLRQQSAPQAAAAAAAQNGRRMGLGAGGVTVLPAIAQKGDIGVYQEAIGTVTPLHTSSVTSQVTGLVMSVDYREGQQVHQGDPLIEIDPRPFQANLLQAEGTLEKDSQILAQAKMDLERYRQAWAENAIAKQNLDDQEKLVAQDEGIVKADQGVVNYDKVQVGWCHITAPFTGRVGLRLVDPGNVVQNNGTNPLVVVAQEQPITVIFTVPEDTLGQIREQLRHGAQLTVDAYDRAAQTKIASGKLLTLDNQIDTTTGTLKLRAIFDNRNGELFPNQFVNTRLLVQTLKDMTLVPSSTIQHNGQTSFVYVIQDGTAQMRTVKPGATEGGMTAVEGVQPGEVVINSSFEKLQPNLKVNIAKAGQAAGASGGTTP
jgi:multidrug efflux system membrane fusion protein